MSYRRSFHSVRCASMSVSTGKPCLPWNGNVIGITSLVLGIGLLWGTPASAQLSEALMKDKSIRVRQLSADQALMELQVEYRELLSTKGKDHEDTREVAAQLAELKRRLAAVGRPVAEPDGAASIQALGVGSLPNPTGQNMSTLGNSTRTGTGSSLSDQQLGILVERYQKMKAELGPDHPTVQRLQLLLETSIESPSAGTEISPVLTPSQAETEVLKGQQDPWELLLGLVRRVETLEQEVLQLRREVRQLRAAAGKTADPNQAIAIP